MLGKRVEVGLGWCSGPEQSIGRHGGQRDRVDGMLGQFLAAKASLMDG